MSPFMQGLQVSLMGLMITFLALGMFILIMVVLQRLFPGKTEMGEEEVVEQEDSMIEVRTSDESEEGAVVAAIMAALEYTRSSNRGQLGQTLMEGRGGWWTSHRQEARQGELKTRR